jgi:Tfp pilus assembly protein PilF
MQSLKSLLPLTLAVYVSLPLCAQEIPAEPDSTDTTVKQKHVDIPSSATTEDLLKKAKERLAEYDTEGASAYLKGAQAKDPNSEGLHLLAAVIAKDDGNVELAESEAKEELQLRPDSADAVLMLASIRLDNNSSENDDVIALLRAYAKSHPDNENVPLTLCRFYVRKGDGASALETLRTVVDHLPSDRQFRLKYAVTLGVLKHFDEEANQLLKAMENSNDLDLINDASYLLLETGLHLDIAEQNMRLVVSKLEDQTAVDELQEAGKSAYARASLIIAAWDSLGWTLFLEGKKQEALQYIEPSWLNSHNQEVGFHLGQLFEDKDKVQALNMYYVARDAAEGPTFFKNQKSLQESIERLEKSGIQATIKRPYSEQRQDHVFSVPRPQSIKGEATFRVQLNAQGISNSKMIQGNKELEPMTSEMNGIYIKNLMPPQSHARLLSTATLICGDEPQCVLSLRMPYGANEVSREK